MIEIEILPLFEDLSNKMMISTWKFKLSEMHEYLPTYYIYPDTLSHLPVAL